MITIKKTFEGGWGYNNVLLKLVYYQDQGKVKHLAPEPVVELIPFRI